MTDEDDEDVPSPIDFHDPEQARAWVEDTVRQRPWRPKFFVAFANALNETFHHPIKAIELGSGLGHLAEEVLKRNAVESYVALDFSGAMHAIARAGLAAFAGKVEFVTRDFRDPDWSVGLYDFDALLTMQAAHETRHRRHLPTFLDAAAKTLRSGGIILYCDHYAEPDSDKNTALFVSREEQKQALETAGFCDVRRLLDESAMALYCGIRR